jgi:hypothetical protein
LNPTQSASNAKKKYKTLNIHAARRGNARVCSQPESTQSTHLAHKKDYAVWLLHAAGV